MEEEGWETCQKIKNRIECLKHGYPFCEARYPDEGQMDCEGNTSPTLVRDKPKAQQL